MDALHVIAIAILYWPLALLLASLFGRRMKRGREQAESELLVKAKALQRIERSRWQ